MRTIHWTLMTIRGGSSERARGREIGGSTGLAVAVHVFAIMMFAIATMLMFFPGVIAPESCRRTALYRDRGPRLDPAGTAGCPLPG